MLITLSRRTAVCQSVAEVELTGVAHLGAVSHRFYYYYYCYYYYYYYYYYRRELNEIQFR